jgi:hypothetical protein
VVIVKIFVFKKRVSKSKYLASIFVMILYSVVDLQIEYSLILIKRT